MAINKGYPSYLTDNQELALQVFNDSKKYTDKIFGGLEQGDLNEIITLDDYDELRAYDGIANVVVVKDFTYTFNATSYTTIGGIFVRVSSGTENGGTLLIADDATKWKRVFDGVHFIPEWWEVGGKSWNGTSYIDNASETSGHPDGIFNERDRIEATSRISTDGVIVLQRSKTYSGLDIFITHYGQRIEGNGATLKRCNAIVVNIASNVTALDTTISLASIPTGMRAGQYIVVLDSDGVNDHSDAVRITDISGTTITVSAGITGSWTVAAASKVLVVPNIIADGQVALTTPGRIHRVTFDGNRDNNTYTQSWLLNSTYVGGGGADKETATSFEQCNFIETPCENVIIGFVELIGCRYNSLGGSLVHPNATRTDSQNSGAYIINCQGEDSNLNNQAKAGHSIGLIEFSANVVNCHIEGNIFSNGGNYILHGLDGYGGRLKFINNICRDFAGIIYDITDPSFDDSEIVDYDVQIIGNDFISCGDLGIQASGVSSQDFREGMVRSRIHIEGNSFVNGRLLCTGAGRIHIVNNSIVFEDGKLGFSGFTDYVYPAESRFYGAVNLSNFDELMITNNTIIMPEASKDATYLRAGIQLIVGYRETGFVHTGVGTASEYYYTQNVLVTNNVIYNFRYGINIREETNANQEQLVGWKFQNNTIYSDVSTSSEGHCMSVYSGALATGNQIYNINSGADYFGIRVLGVVTDGAGSLTRLHGAHVADNWIYGQGKSLSIINANSIVTRNFYQGTLTDSSTSSHVTGNTQIASGIISNYTSPENPKIKAMLDDIAYYA